LEKANILCFSFSFTVKSAGVKPYKKSDVVSLSSNTCFYIHPGVSTHPKRA
jgi:hypothetical protein